MSKLVLCLLLLLPTAALAVDGFAEFKFGMTRDQARAAYPEQLLEKRDFKHTPPGLDDAPLVMRDMRLFDDAVDVYCFFRQERLAVIRLQFKRARPDNIKQVLEFYEPTWGKAVLTRQRVDATTRKLTYSWPWQGVDLREVKDGDRIEYQRVDFTALIKQQWQKAEGMVCTILPKSSSCPFPDTYCPPTDANKPDGRREVSFPLGSSEGDIRCTYEGGALRDVRLVVEKPDARAADWMQRILQQRLGDGVTREAEAGGDLLFDTAWAEHGVSLRMVRKRKTRTSSGWTGPVTYIRLKRGQ